MNQTSLINSPSGICADPAEPSVIQVRHFSQSSRSSAVCLQHTMATIMDGCSLNFPSLPSFASLGNIPNPSWACDWLGQMLFPRNSKEGLAGSIRSPRLFSPCCHIWEMFQGNFDCFRYTLLNVIQNKLDKFWAGNI